MGIILCKKHGRQGFYEVCGHIHDEFKQDIYREYREFSLGQFYGIIVCDECWKNHNLDKFQKNYEMTDDEFFELDEKEQERKEKEWSEIYNSVNRRGCCVQCVAEIKVKQARRNNETDPFPVFEKTLTEKQKKIVEELEKNLLEKFQFQRSVVSQTSFQDYPAMFVQSGAFTYPLAIKIYYYVDEKEQDKIIDFVNGFLQNIELNQAKIEFWEAEIWIATENQYGLHNYHRGEEKLLREVYLNC